MDEELTTGQDATGEVEPEQPEGAAAATQVPEPAGEPEPTAAPTDQDKLTKENVRIAKALERLQVERDEYKRQADEATQRFEQKPEPTIPKAVDSELAKHPALKGKQFDDEGNVIYGGHSVSPEFVIQLYEDGQAPLKQATELIRNWETQQREAEFTQKEAVARTELARAVDSTIAEMRESALPGLPKEHAEAVDRLVALQLDRPLAELYDAGKLTAETIGTRIASVLSDTRSMLGVLGAKQFEDNQKYAEQHKVKPGATTGSKPPKPFEQWTRAERDAAATQWAQQAEKESRGE